MRINQKLIIRLISAALISSVLMSNSISASEDISAQNDLKISINQNLQIV